MTPLFMTPSKTIQIWGSSYDDINDFIHCVMDSINEPILRVHKHSIKNVKSLIVPGSCKNSSISYETDPLTDRVIAVNIRIQKYLEENRDFLKNTACLKGINDNIEKLNSSLANSNQLKV